MSGYENYSIAYYDSCAVSAQPVGYVTYESKTQMIIAMLNWLVYGLDEYKQFEMIIEYFDEKGDMCYAQLISFKSGYMGVTLNVYGSGAESFEDDWGEFFTLAYEYGVADHDLPYHNIKYNSPLYDYISGWWLVYKNYEHTTSYKLLETVWSNF